MGTSRVEWIGAASPQADDRVVYRKLMRLYTQEQLNALDDASAKIQTIIRQDGKTARKLTTRYGFTRDYLFGHRRGTFVQDMDADDVKHLFSDEYPDSAEFKNLDDPAHEHRVPIVPWAYIDKLIYDILRQAASGPIIQVTSGGVYKSPQELISEYERRFDVERAEHLRNQPIGKR